MIVSTIFSDKALDRVVFIFGEGDPSGFIFFIDVARIFCEIISPIGPPISTTYLGIEGWRSWRYIQRVEWRLVFHVEP